MWCRDGGVLRAYAHAALFAYQRCRRLAKVMCCWELVSQWLPAPVVLGRITGYVSYQKRKIDAQRASGDELYALQRAQRVFLGQAPELAGERH